MNLKKKFVVLAAAIMVVVAASCTTKTNEYGFPIDSIVIKPSQALFSGGLAIPVAVASIQAFYPEYTMEDVKALIADLDSDPANYSYYVPALNDRVTLMARRFAYLNAVFVFSEKTVGYSVTDLKKLARQRMAVGAAEEELETLEAEAEKKEGEEDQYSLDFDDLTDEELAALTAVKLEELSEEEKAIMQQVRINNSLAGAGITALVEQSAALALDISAVILDLTAELANNPIWGAVELGGSIRTMKEIDASVKSIENVRPALDKNLNASRTVIKALYEVE